MESEKKKQIGSFKNERTRHYMIYLIIFMGSIALMDQYLSMIETTAIPNILQEYSVTNTEYAWWKVVYFIPTFLIFLLNGLTDVIGRKKSLLILIFLFGFTSLGIVYATPSFHLYMLFFTVIIFATVSNMWAIQLAKKHQQKNEQNIYQLYFSSV